MKTARAIHWQQTLHELLPISAAMAVSVGELPDGRLALSAALAPNRNDKGTGFGGSITALGIMAGWCAVSEAMAARYPNADVAIQRMETDYLSPAQADFSASVVPLTPFAVERFLQTLARRRRRARISVTVEISCGDERVAVLNAEYVGRLGG